MRALFGGTIAVVLLGIYVWLVGFGYEIVECATRVGCTDSSVGQFKPSMAQALAEIGGLVAALVIAELAITKPGEPPASRVLATDASDRAKTLLKIVSAVYVLVWLLTGLLAYVVGLNHPDTLPAFTSVGQSWLGLAVAAAYAYFGLNRNGAV